MSCNVALDTVIVNANGGGWRAADDEFRRFRYQELLDPKWKGKMIMDSEAAYFLAAREFQKILGNS